MAQQHPLAANEGLCAADLAQEGFILFPPGYELRERTLELCRAGGFMPHVVLDGAEMDTVLRFAAAGLGMALVPRLALDGADGLAGVAVRDVPLTRTLGLVTHSARTLPPAAVALQAFLRERLPGQSRNVGQ